MKKLVLAIGLVIASVVNVFGQDTNISNQIKQIISDSIIFDPINYKDHTYLKDNMMKIILANDNSKLFEAIDEEKQLFGSIRYWKYENGLLINVNNVVPYDDPNITVYTATTLYEIINDLKLNFPKTKSFKPDEIKISEYNENYSSLIWEFENNKIEYKLQITFHGSQIQIIDFSSIK